ncbi:MAG: hypothetical protein L0Y58_22875 [Verrucomicrobia subdivision 3 bacterium]|nr:hypothetical protein [Limisphaerales bacterium]
MQTTQTELLERKPLRLVAEDRMQEPAVQKPLKPAKDRDRRVAILLLIASVLLGLVEAVQQLVRR